ncbi:hypothetical protein MyNCGM121_41140 [Achromobacter xylosoxidans]
MSGSLVGDARITRHAYAVLGSGALVLALFVSTLSISSVSALCMACGDSVIAPGGVQFVAPGENSKSMGERLGSVAPHLPELLVKPHFGKIGGGHDGAELQ